MMAPTRRTLLGGLAALPFIRMSGGRAAEAGRLNFGLSSYPPNLQPWSRAGTAAGTQRGAWIGIGALEGS